MDFNACTSPLPPATHHNDSRERGQCLFLKMWCASSPEIWMVLPLFDQSPPTNRHWCCFPALNTLDQKLGALKNPKGLSSISTHISGTWTCFFNATENCWTFYYSLPIWSLKMVHWYFLFFFKVCHHYLGFSDGWQTPGNFKPVICVSVHSLEARGGLGGGFITFFRFSGGL